MPAVARRAKTGCIDTFFLVSLIPARRLGRGASNWTLATRDQTKVRRDHVPILPDSRLLRPEESLRGHAEAAKLIAAMRAGKAKERIARRH